MSRAYRIKVRETLRRVIRAEDHVSSQLELLEILPPEQMAELLAKELVDRGFQRQGGLVVRKEGPTTIRVELATGEVTVQAASSEQVELEGEKTGFAYDDVGPKREDAESHLRDELRKSLEKDASDRTRQLQKQVTDQLEAQLVGLKKELDQAVNRATAAALKVKASQLGQIKELTEDPASGSLTIVVEV